MTALPELLDRPLVQQMFACDDAAEQQQVREMVALLREDTAMRLADLSSGAEVLPPAAAGRELHQLRGAVSGFGLSRAMAQLTELEHGWAELSPGARRTALAQATETLAAGLAALEEELPFLRNDARKLA